MKEHQSYENKMMLDLLSKRNELAFTELYVRFRHKLSAIAYNRLKEIQEAEDNIDINFYRDIS